MRGWSRREVLVQGAAVALTSQFVTPRTAVAATGIAFGEYVKHDALGLAKLVADGEVTAAELLETAIARTDAVNPKLNAIVIPHYELAREAVRAGLPTAPFRGVPWLLKDLHLKCRVRQAGPHGTNKGAKLASWRNLQEANSVNKQTESVKRLITEA